MQGPRVGRGARSADLRSGVLLALCFLALALHRGLLVMLAPASLGEDAALLDLLVEATQGAFERLVLTHSDFCQSRFTSPGQGSCVLRRARGQPALTSPNGGPVQGWRSIAEPPGPVKRSRGWSRACPDRVVRWHLPHQEITLET